MHCRLRLQQEMHQARIRFWWTLLVKHTKFLLDPLEDEVGDRIIALLQQGTKFDNFQRQHQTSNILQAATRLSIASSRSALAKRRASRTH
ncbi:unnamed protein product [Arabidopsis halleri]